MTTTALNVFGRPLAPCSFDPMTGFFRDGCCHTDPSDRGLHVVCVVVNEDFLQFSRDCGNDLSTPHPEFAFPGLQPGDRWCLCALRWLEALQHGMAPEVVLESTHLNTLGVIGLDQLRLYAIDPDGSAGQARIEP